MRRFTAAIIYLFLISTLSSCLKDDFKDLKTDDWEPEIALPLVFASYEGKDVIEEFESEGLITSNSENTITIVYKGELFKIEANDLMKLPTIPYAFIDTFINLNIGNLIDAQIEQLEINTGKITYDINVDNTRDVIVELVIPGATNNGKPFSEEILIPYAGNANMQKSGEISLQNASFDLSSGGTTTNSFTMYYRAREAKTMKPVGLSSFVGEFKDLSYGLVTGEFPDFSYTLEDEQIKVDLFENFKSGEVIIEDPKIHLQFVNSFGIPVGAEVRNFRGIKDGMSFPLNGNLINNKIEIGFPPLNSPNRSLIVDEYFNTDNSNIRSFISLSPGVLNYSFDFELSSQTPGNEVNYIRDSSLFSANVELELPFYTTLDNVTIRDTFDITFEEIDNAERVQFKLIVDNSFPINAGIQFVFIDEFKNQLDSLLPMKKNIFRSNLPNSNGIVTESLRTETFFEMDAERFEKIKDSKQLVMKMQLVTAGGGDRSVKFLTTNAISMKLGVIAKLKDL